MNCAFEPAAPLASMKTDAAVAAAEQQALVPEGAGCRRRVRRAWAAASWWRLWSSPMTGFRMSSTANTSSCRTLSTIDGGDTLQRPCTGGGVAAHIARSIAHRARGGAGACLAIPHACNHEDPAMTLSEELSRLHELHQQGALSAEEFARAKARLLGEPGSSVPPVVNAVNALRRSRSDRWIAGVCGGLAQATGAQAWVWRLLFAVLLFCGGAGLLIYALMWIFVPAESVSASRAQPTNSHAA